MHEQKKKKKKVKIDNKTCNYLPKLNKQTLSKKKYTCVEKAQQSFTKIAAHINSSPNKKDKLVNNNLVKKIHIYQIHARKKRKSIKKRWKREKQTCPKFCDNSWPSFIVVFFRVWGHATSTLLPPFPFLLPSSSSLSSYFSSSSLLPLPGVTPSHTPVTRRGEKQSSFGTKLLLPSRERKLISVFFFFFFKEKKSLVNV